jgi:hypothetical protein
MSESTAGLAGRIRCLAGIALASEDGWTRLNSEARQLLDKAAEALDMLHDSSGKLWSERAAEWAREVQRLQSELESRR